MSDQGEMFREAAVPVGPLKELCKVWMQRAREQEPQYAVGEDLCRVELERLIENAEKST